MLPADRTGRRMHIKFPAPMPHPERPGPVLTPAGPVGYFLPGLRIRVSSTLSTPGTDLVIGSRWVQGGTAVNWPLYRQLLTRTGSTYARTMPALKISDMTAGYRAFRRTTLEKLDLDAVESVGYGFTGSLLGLRRRWDSRSWKSLRPSPSANLGGRR